MTTQDSDFAKMVKIELIKRTWNLSDLAVEVNRATGLFCDQAYLSKIMSGKRNAPKIVSAMKEILNFSDTA